MSEPLLIAVVVLGTAMGMTLFMGTVWACGRWCWKRRGNYIFHERCCWLNQHTHSQDCYEFPPPHRDMIEMRCLQGCNSLRGQTCRSAVTNNNTGVSRGLGLRGSCFNASIPAPPAPRSWTPSPPFDPEKVSVQPRYDKKHHSRTRGKSFNASKPLFNVCKLNSNKKNVLPGGACSVPHLFDQCEQVEYPKDNFEDITLDSVSCSSNSSTGAVDICPSSGRARYFSQRKNVMSRSNQRRLKQPLSVTDFVQKSEVKDKRCGASTYPDVRRPCLNDDMPAACSSYCVSPSRVTILPRNYTNFTCAHGSNTNTGQSYVPNNVPTTALESSLHNNISSGDHSKKKCFSLPQIQEVLGSSRHSSCSPTTSGIRSQSNPRIPTPNSMPQQPVSKHKKSFSKSDFADKYGFCHSCGCHPDVHQLDGGIKKITRSTQTRWSPLRSAVIGNIIQEATVDPTPSLSWDHLTPAPSPSHTLRGIPSADENDDVEEGENEASTHLVQSDIIVERKQESLHSSDEGAVGGW